MPIDFEIQQGLPCVFTNLPNLIKAKPLPSKDLGLLLDPIDFWNLQRPCLHPTCLASQPACMTGMALSKNTKRTQPYTLLHRILCLGYKNILKMQSK